MNPHGFAFKQIDERICASWDSSGIPVGACFPITSPICSPEAICHLRCDPKSSRVASRLSVRDRAIIVASPIGVAECCEIMSPFCWKPLDVVAPASDHILRMAAENSYDHAKGSVCH